jgi:pectinesterase
MLGRYHRDAQFFLVDCLFGANMKDADIYLVPTSNSIQWGRRVYYADCHREEGKDYAWFNNNLPGSLKKEEIGVKWLFGTKWNPELK